MELLATAAVVVSAGFVVGALARFALPGPDPMGFWATSALGIAGSAIAGGIGYAAGGVGPAFLGSLVAATLILLVYRRVIQRRPLTGPRAKLPPRR